MCKLNPKVDFAFKKLFGSENNKDILIGFINSLLSESEQIKDVIIKNPYNFASYRSGKMSILDIKAVDENGVWYDIEMQVAPQNDYGKRAMYYWAKTYSDQIESGNQYRKLRKTIVISILDFKYLAEEEYHNIIKPMNIKSNNQFFDLMELHFIELPKCDKSFKDIKTTLDRWIVFLNKAYEIDMNKIPQELEEDKNLKKAISELEIMYLSKEERETYEGELDFLRVQESQLETAKDIGIQQGIQEGREKGIKQGIKQGVEQGEKNKAIEIAKSLMDVLDVETIALKTGLSVEEIKSIGKLRHLKK